MKENKRKEKKKKNTTWMLDGDLPWLDFFWCNMMMGSRWWWDDDEGERRRWWVRRGVIKKIMRGKEEEGDGMHECVEMKIEIEKKEGVAWVYGGVCEVIGWWYYIMSMVRLRLVS